jgi:hypothetical protein
MYKFTLVREEDIDYRGLRDARFRSRNPLTLRRFYVKKSRIDFMHDEKGF